MSKPTSLAAMASRYEFAAMRLANAEPLSDEHARAELLTALTWGATMVTHIQAHEPLFAVDALARGASRSEVARSMRITLDTLRDRLIGWADRERFYDRITPERHAEIERLVGEQDRRPRGGDGSWSL